MTDFVVKEAVASSHTPEWKDPLVTPAPPGTSVFLLTEGGVAVRGVWREDGGFVAWCPLPAKPDWLKDRLTQLRRRAGYEKLRDSRRSADSSGGENRREEAGNSTTGKSD